MRIFSGLIAFVFLVTLSSFGNGGPGVKILIKNVRKGKGKVRVGLYTESGFPKMGKELKGFVLFANDSDVSFELKDLKTGKYALAVFQDYDNDGKLDKNLFGAPAEPYAFSNNKYGFMSAPSFEEVSFQVNEGQQGERLVILLN